MKILAGLGNPGRRYAGHRHNIGFMAVDSIVQRHGLSTYRRRFHGVISEGYIASERVLVLKPETYMNRSGTAVAEAVGFFKVALEDLIVFHDELDLAPGKVRVKLGGGTAGHNGLRSIGAHLGSDFKRVRIGIGHPGDKNRVHSYVLSNFAKAEAPLVEAVLAGIARGSEDLVAGRDAEFMNKVALAVQGVERRAES